MRKAFFEKQLPGSKIKSKIVVGYFWKWAKIMVKQVKGRGDKIGYIDFFCGPGTYEDGSDSTPVQVIKAALSDKEMSQMLVTIFNDADSKNVERLKSEIGAIEEGRLLKFSPDINNDRIGTEIVDEFRKMEIIPSLIFIDPFGYKGLSLGLIASVIKDWGCDCIFFFNYNRINAAINNPFMKEHINALFGVTTAESLRTKLSALPPKQREALLLEYFQTELKKVRGNYSVCFKFYQQGKRKTSHFLFFVSKHPLAYKLMKETMADNCGRRGGVPTYEYDPNSNSSTHQAKLFENDDSEIQKLAFDLLNSFKGKTVNRKEVFESHNIGRPYIESNYKDALLFLEQEKHVVMFPSIEKRRKYQGKPTLGETVAITF